MNLNINIQDKKTNGKVITFAETTTGYLVLINGIITWFIRYEMNEGYEPGKQFITYRSEDGGKGFKLIPSNESQETRTWGHRSLNDAQLFTVNYEAAISRQE